jgi:hypothetical protein
MTISKTLATLTLATSLVLLGCATNAAMPPPAASPTPAAAEPATAEPATADTLTITSDDDYIARGNVMLDQMTAAFQAAGSDCDRLADQLNAFGALNRPVLRGVAAYDKTHPGAKAKFNTASKPKLDAFTAIATQSLKTCESNARVQDAASKLGT